MALLAFVLRLVRIFVLFEDIRLARIAANEPSNSFL